MEEDYSGMTVNERLFVAKLLDQFDKAAHAGDRQKMVELLRKVQLDQIQAEKTADSLLANPKFYGY